MKENLTKEDLYLFQMNFLNLIERVGLIANKEYLTKEECFNLFGIKERTLTELRKNRAITYTKVGNSCVYKYSSLISYLQEREIKAI